MRQQYLTRTGVGASSPIVMNLNATPFNVGFGVVVTGSATYTIQHTFDNLGSGFVTWYPHPTIAGKTDNQDGNYAFPVSGIRVLVTAATNGSTVTATVIQAGII